MFLVVLTLAVVVFLVVMLLAVVVVVSTEPFDQKRYRGGCGIVRSVPLSTVLVPVCFLGLVETASKHACG